MRLTLMFAPLIGNRNAFRQSVIFRNASSMDGYGVDRHDVLPNTSRPRFCSMPTFRGYSQPACPWWYPLMMVALHCLCQPGLAQKPYRPGSATVHAKHSYSNCQNRNMDPGWESDAASDTVPAERNQLVAHTSSAHDHRRAKSDNWK